LSIRKLVGLKKILPFPITKIFQKLSQGTNEEIKFLRAIGLVKAKEP
jgi:hypothetical protein